jgi:membrane protein YdbS with pleckstrin-like domain
VETSQVANAQTDIADGVLRPVSESYVTTESISWWITTGIIAVGGGFFALPVGLFGAGPVRVLFPSIWVSAVLLLVFFSFKHPAWKYRRLRYRVTDAGVEIWKGIVWRRVIYVLRNRVQHTDVTDGPVLRRYGLATLTIFTAGTRHSMVTLEGLERGIALGIREFLIHRGSTHAV